MCMSEEDKQHLKKHKQHLKNTHFKEAYQEYVLSNPKHIKCLCEDSYILDKEKQIVTQNENCLKCDILCLALSDEDINRLVS